MLRNLDVYNSGTIDYKVLATYCILLKSTIAKDEDIDHIKKVMLTNEASCSVWMS